MEETDHSDVEWIKARGFHDTDPLIEQWMQAAFSGDSVAVTEFLDSGIDINARDRIGQTALFKAVCGGHHEIIRVLLERGAGLNDEDCYTYTALTHAIHQSQPRYWNSSYVPDPEPLRLVKAAGARYNLIDAFWANDIELARVRLEEGANPDHGEGSYHGPLLLEAARRGNVAMIDLLTDFGANLEAQDDLGNRPLLSAAEYRQLAAVKRLLERGADIDARDWFGVTALGHAAMRDHREIVELLFSHGARRGIVDALAMNDPTILGALIDEELRKDRENDGINRDVDGISDYMAGRIAMTAVGTGNPTMVRLILDRGAAHLHKDDGHSLLAEAARHGHLEVMKLLPDRGASLEAVGNDGLTPLAWAIREGQDQAASWLRRAGALG